MKKQLIISKCYHVKPAWGIGDMIAGGAGISHKKELQGKELPAVLASTPVVPGQMLGEVLGIKFLVRDTRQC
jgi:hypothetical protein